MVYARASWRGGCLTGMPGQQVDGQASKMNGFRTVSQEWVLRLSPRIEPLYEEQQHLHDH